MVFHCYWHVIRAYMLLPALLIQPSKYKWQRKYRQASVEAVIREFWGLEKTLEQVQENKGLSGERCRQKCGDFKHQANKQITQGRIFRIYFWVATGKSVGIPHCAALPDSFSALSLRSPLSSAQLNLLLALSDLSGPSILAPWKKKAAELAKRVLGGDSQITLSIKELVSVSPMMADKLISVIWESAGVKAEGNHVSFDVQLGEVKQAVEETPRRWRSMGQRHRD
ncbi:uncharacterized protein VP01_734g3 [Puccinia sorghi]|uniref:Uncharacterized protein n=1 Tax=Puccinia sorghi TaxID=27349 RepID=A0A0L6UDP4_9BASI|nr:uncharacterized protein VP01_734g3 [Puccinia sorghi]